MLKIKIPSAEMYDEQRNEFFMTEEYYLTLEHSLVSISKWESKWKKSFLNSDKTNDEIIDYIKFMTITQNVPNEAYSNLTVENIEDIKKYIEDPMTATWFRKDDSPGRREVITSELIYYWMISLNIPFECQKWHLNKLLTLIKVCSVKNTPPKKMGKKDTMSRNRSLNQSRRKALNTRG